jgi:hypothetical protein
MSNSISNINDSSTGKKEYTFRPEHFGRKHWTIITGRTGGRADKFTGEFLCEKGIKGDLGPFIREHLYPHRDAGDTILDMSDLFDIRDKCYFEILRFGDRDLGDGQVRFFLKKQRNRLILKLGSALYVQIDDQHGQPVHVRIANMLNRTGHPELHVSVREGEPTRITEKMVEIANLSNQFRLEFQGAFRAATIDARYEEGGEDSNKKEEEQVPCTIQWRPGEDEPTLLRVVRNAPTFNELVLHNLDEDDDEEGDEPQPAPVGRYAKVAEG